MFRLEHHRRIASLLDQLNAELLQQHHCLFGGGTAIALRYGEFRQSVDVDLLVSDRQGYRELRQLIRRDNSLKALWKDPQHPPKESREPLTDQYGIRAGVIVEGDDGVFNRDLIDLAHLPLSQASWRRALAKAEEAYGDAIRIDLGKALERLWQRLLNLQRLAAAPSTPTPD